jgi:hypothetical protein
MKQGKAVTKAHTNLGLREDRSKRTFGAIFYFKIS